MGSFTNAAEIIILNQWFCKKATTVPATWYIALLTAIADVEAGTVTEVSAANWTNYARLGVTNNDTNFPEVTDDDTAQANAVKLEWAAPEGIATRVTVVGWAIYDAATDGVCYAVHELTTPLDVNTGTPVYFEVGDLTISVG